MLTIVLRRAAQGVLTALTFGLLLGGLLACQRGARGGGEGAEATGEVGATLTLPAPAATASGPFTLTVQCRCDRAGINTAFVTWMENAVGPAFAERMAAQGKQVTVQVQPFSGSDEALRTLYFEELRAGAGGDLLILDGFWIPELSAEGLLRPLDAVAGPTVNGWEGWNVISVGTRDLLSYDGQTYGIALGTDTRAIFYRRDLFEQAGIPTPWQPTSWEELLDTARTLKARLPGVTPLQINAGTAMGEATTMQGYAMMLLGAGAHLYDFQENKWITRSPAILEALRFYAEVYGGEALGDVALQTAADGRNQSFAAFSEGRIAMLVESDYFWRSVLAGDSVVALPNRNEIVAWAKMPAIRPGVGYQRQDFVTISGGTGVVLNPRTPHPQEAWELMTVMFSRDTLALLQEAEPRLRVRSDVPVPGDPLLSDMAHTLLPLTTVRPLSPFYPRVSEEAQRMTERVVTGAMTPEEAMAAYAAAVETIVGVENTMAAP